MITEGPALSYLSTRGIDVDVLGMAVTDVDFDERALAGIQ